MSTALVRFLACATRPPVAAFAFAARGFAVGPALLSALSQAPPGTPAPALAAAFSRAAQALAPAAAPVPASAEYDFRFDVLTREGGEVHVELREWTSEATVLSGSVEKLRRHLDAGFGQC
jgi:hypothetical protein